MPFSLSELELRPLLHLALHIAVPGVVAAICYRDRWVYAPGRCSIGFHPLHTVPAIFAYGLLGVWRRTRLLGLGLLIHIALDALDCLLIR